VVRMRSMAAPRAVHRRPTCQHTGPVNPAWMPRSRQRGCDSDYRGCHRLQIDSSAGEITDHLFGVKARSTRRRSVQLPLPFSHDGCRASRLRVSLSSIGTNSVLTPRAFGLLLT
jgi:hypothetical protein